MINLHESGLKATKYKGLLEESQKKEEEMERQIEQGVVPGVAITAQGEGGGGGGGGGWKKWVLFWQK